MLVVPAQCHASCLFSKFLNDTIKQNIVLLFISILGKLNVNIDCRINNFFFS